MPNDPYQRHRGANLFDPSSWGGAAEDLTHDIGTEAERGWNNITGQNGPSSDVMNQIFGWMQGMHPSQPNRADYGLGAAGDWNESFGRGLTGASINAGFDPSQSNATRAQQMALIQQLQAQASGSAPSIAEAQLRQAAQQNAAQASSAMTQARGMGAGAAQRQVGVQRAGIGQDLAGQSAIARLQEQMMARSALGQQLGAMRGQDLGQAQLGAGFNLQGQTATQNARQAALEALMRQAAQAQMGNMAFGQATQGANESWNNTLAGMYGGARGQANQNYQNSIGLIMKLIQAGATAAGAGSGMTAGAGAAGAGANAAAPAYNPSTYPGV